MQLTSENYYSQEANQEYMSVSGYMEWRNLTDAGRMKRVQRCW